MSDITIVRDNGTLIGSDGDHLYTGERKQVGYDELTVTNSVTTDPEFGEVLERTTALPDGTVQSVTSINKQGFVDAALPKVMAGLDDSATKADIDAALDAAWEAEKTIDAHSKVFIDALVDGVPTTVEKKITYIAWTQK